MKIIHAQLQILIAMNSIKYEGVVCLSRPTVRALINKLMREYQFLLVSGTMLLRYFKKWSLLIGRPRHCFDTSNWSCWWR
jgi:hypothetical protein